MVLRLKHCCLSDLWPFLCLYSFLCTVEIKDYNSPNTVIRLAGTTCAAIENLINFSDESD